MTVLPFTYAVYPWSEHCEFGTPHYLEYKIHNVIKNHKSVRNVAINALNLTRYCSRDVKFVFVINTSILPMVIATGITSNYIDVDLNHNDKVIDTRCR